MTTHPISGAVESIAPSEQYLISSVRDLDFGVVEVVVHEGQIVEVSQKRRRRFTCEGQRRPAGRG
jgi:hypothetical protein